MPTSDKCVIIAYTRILRVQVKTPPSQNVHELVKTSPNTKKDWSKRPHKTSPFFKGDFSKKYGILPKKKPFLVSGTNV